MSFVPIAELRNHTLAIAERAHDGEVITILEDDVPVAVLSPVRPVKKKFLTVEDLLAMRPEHPALEPHPHDYVDDTTDDLHDFPWRTP